MFFLGLFLLIVGAVLAFKFHYHLEVKNTNKYGVMEVENYAGHMMKRVGVSILLLAIMVPGLGLFVASFFVM